MSGSRKEPTILARALVDAIGPLPVPDRERLLVLAAWSEAVGLDVARSARPLTLEDGTLLVEVEHEGWIGTLRTFEGAIVERLSSRTGLSIRGLSTRVKRRGGCR